jgi:hypothetical protein
LFAHCRYPLLRPIRTTLFMFAPFAFSVRLLLLH